MSTSAAIAAPVPAGGATASGMALDERVGGEGEGVLPPSLPPQTDDGPAAAADAAVDDEPSPQHAGAVAPQEATTVKVHMAAEEEANETNGTAGTGAAVVSEPTKKLTAAGASSAAAPRYKVPAGVPQYSEVSPEVRASWLGLLFFSWLDPVVIKGAKTALEQEDMYAVRPDVEAAYCSDLFAREWEVELERAKADPTKEYVPSVTMAMYRIFKVPFWVGGCCKAVIDGLQFLQPILLEWILEFMAKSQIDRPGFEKPPAWEGYVLAVAIGVNPLITTILSNLYFTVMMTIGLRSRTILTTHLYKKSLKLSPAARQAMSVGQIVNMMSTDTAKVDLFCGYMHFIWSGMEQVAVAIALLIRAIGPPALAGLGVVIIMIPFQGMVIRHLQQLRKATVKYTDRRVKLMNEILQGIRVIKVYAWEDSFLQKMISIRAEEMRFVQSSAYTRAWNSTLMQTGPLLMSLLAFITLGLTTDNLEAQYIFSSLTLFNLLRMPLMLLPMTIAFGSDAKIGIQRIQAFLLADELHSEPEYVDTDKFAVKVSDANFEWEKAVAEVNTVGESMKDAAGGATSAKAAAPVPAIAEAKEQEAGAVVAKDAAADPASGPFHLDGVSFEVPKGSLTVIVGAVGSGKSSLLAGILGEMKRASGSVQIAGSVGYCPQQAWIQNATLKQNVLFGLPFDQEKYDEAIRTCALEADIAVLPAGDATEIGEKGINLSGGQKQRVNLARAVYFDADIIMLDDPLSAVDAHVSKYLFNNCICTKLRQKTRILVTHQLQYVSSCDQVLFVEHGRITEQGTYTQLMRNKGRFFTLMSTYVGEESDDEGEDGEAEGEENVAEEGEGQQASLLEVPSPSAGNDDPSPSAGLARSADNALSSLATAAGSVAPARPERQSKKRRNRGLKTAKSSAHADKAKALLRSGRSDAAAADPEAKKKELAAATQLMQAEERTKGGVPWSVYLYYVSHCGGWVLVLVSLIFMCLQTAASTWTTWWLGLWSNDEYDRGNNWYLGIYAGIGLSQCVFALVGTIVSAYMGVIAAVELHTLSFWSVLRAPMAFFDTTPIGRIINRFSKDQDVIDSLLMDTLRMIVFMSLNVLATFIMIIVVTPFFAIPLVPILVVYYFVQKSYRNTSRELKRLESISRSPLFAHFSESLTGLATIRAYRAQKSFIRANEVRMDDNNRSYYLLVLTQRWLSIRVETIGAFIAFFAALIIVIQRDSLSAGNSGVSLSYAIGITSLLNWVVRQTVEAENSMNSVERSKFYTDSIAQEAAAHVPVVDDLVAKQHWPQRGEIQFEDLQIRYRDGLPLVLHGISLNIKGGERVGIVGRTGAGKSSLMVALFRIVEAAGGSIKIDGQDISALGLNALRSKLAIIPQDPVLYSGTVRSNLDPFDQYTDAQLWDVLEKSYLKATISALDLKLQAPISEGGENMSVGERCQLCLARAMLRNAKVLIMDEATASVDMQTDAFIQNSLRKHFNCTLLTIAHRLNTICDYDRVLVLSFGRVQEYDSPANLLRDPNSAFSSMVNETGEVNAALLRNIAFKAEQGIRIGAEDLLGLEGAEAAAVAASADAAAASPVAAKAATLPSGPVGLTGGSEDADAAAAVDTSQVRWLDDDGAADDAEVQL